MEAIGSYMYLSNKDYACGRFCEQSVEAKTVNDLNM